MFNLKLIPVEEGFWGSTLGLCLFLDRYKVVLNDFITMIDIVYHFAVWRNRLNEGA